MPQLMRRFLLTVIPALATMVVFSNCAGIPGESPENMRERMERQDKLIERRGEKRQIRSEAADRRYNDSWNRAMGRDPEKWQQF